MADLRTLYFVLPQVEPYDAEHQPDDLDDDEKFLDGAITRRAVKSKLPKMYLRCGYLMAENQSPNTLFEKQVLDRLPEVVGGEDDEYGDFVFEINFSQDNCNYVVKLFFSPKEESDYDDNDSHQEEGDQLGSDYYSDDGEEAYEDYDNDDMEEIEEDCDSDSDDIEGIDEDYDIDDMEEIDEDYKSDDEKETHEDEQNGNRVFELYFPQEDRNYIVRLVFVVEEGARFLEEGEEFLFIGLQRVAGISHDIEEVEDEVPAIDNKSSSALPEVVSEISRRLMEAKVGEPDDIRTIEDEEKQSRIKYLEMAEGSKNEICTFIDPLMILERPSHLTAQIVRDHLQLHSSA